jgi:hypothetical protein
MSSKCVYFSINGTRPIVTPFDRSINAGKPTLVSELYNKNPFLFTPSIAESIRAALIIHVNNKYIPYLRNDNIFSGWEYCEELRYNLIDMHKSLANNYVID